MTKMSDPIVFFGSGPVAAESLALLSQDFVIEAVVTKPRPEHHKGEVPVLSTAENLGLPVFTAQNRAELDTLFATAKFKARLAILIDFGIIVSQQVIDFFPLGIVNSHFSLLPELRGADPITFSILNGDERTGVSLMLLVQAMDEGPLLTQVAYKLPEAITTPELTKKLLHVSYEALKQTIPQYVAGKIKPQPQPVRQATYSRRLTKEDGLLDWTKPADVLEREIRAFSGWPKSRTLFGATEVIVTMAHSINASGNPGNRAVQDGEPLVYCGDGALIIDKLKPSGKKEMPGKAFLAGYKDIFLS